MKQETVNYSELREQAKPVFNMINTYGNLQFFPVHENAQKSSHIFSSAGTNFRSSSTHFYLFMISVDRPCSNCLYLRDYVLQAHDGTVRKEAQGCGSGMFNPDPDFYPSRTPNPGSRIQQQHQKEKIFLVVLPFFVATNIIKL